MIFSIPRIIRDLSLGMTLEPGDIIATGTPQGVGFAMDPPQFLGDGDEVVITIEELGELRNRVEQVS
jgi:acylpyruvate hydrolase